MKCTKKSKIPGMYIVFFCPWNMKRVYFRIYFLSNDHEPRLSRFQSVEGEDKVTETEGINAEGGDFDEEDTEEVEIGEFWGGMEDLDSMASVGREEAGEDCEMWADLDSVQNSELEAVPIVWDLEPSINDSVSPIISFISGDILNMFDRTTNQVKAKVEMKTAWTMQVKEWEK